MELLGVRIEMPANAPVLLLAEQAPEPRLLPIFIGASEATAIALALENIEVPRPMTHDLILLLLADAGISIRRVLVTELRDKTFFAELELAEGDEVRSVSCRPSDAVALAVRCRAPIFASETVLDEAGYRDRRGGGASGSDEEVDPNVVVEQFREFIDSVDPEDFKS